MNDGDLQVHVRFDDLQLSIVHEGESGNLQILQGTLLQLGAAWRGVLTETFGASRVKDEP